MSLLEFVFTDVWHFFGCFAILLAIAILFNRKPNVTNFYEIVVKGDDDDEEPYSCADIACEKKARTDMWKRDV